MREDEEIEAVESEVEEPVEPETYEDLVQEEPEREVDLGEMPTSVSEAEEGVESSSDLKSAMRAITPKFKNKRLNDLLQPILTSRVFPDNYLDLNYVLNMTMFEEDDDEADFIGTLTATQVVTSKAYEGRHIIDILEIAGVAHEEEMEQLAGKLNI